MRKCALFMSCVAFFLSGCVGSGGGLTGSSPVINGISPCQVVAGETIIIYGTNFTPGDLPSVSFAGGVTANGVIDSAYRMHVVVPAGATSGTLRIMDGFVVSNTAQYIIGARTPVAEIEPNDDINGTDATDVAMNMVGTGTLASVGDKDHFKFGCLTGTWYKVKVQPPVVNIVYINGNGRQLDVKGEAVVQAAGDVELIGLTGGTGSYTLSLTAVTGS